MLKMYVTPGETLTKRMPRSRTCEQAGVAGTRQRVCIMPTPTGRLMVELARNGSEPTPGPFTMPDAGFAYDPLAQAWFYDLDAEEGKS